MSNPEQLICLRSSARTDTGKVRGNNEDSIHLWTTGDHLVLAVVADGMGGAVAGEEASRIAIETIQTKLLAPDGSQPGSRDFRNIDQTEVGGHLQASILDANNTIVESATENPELKGMGTTVTMALVRDTEVIIGHVGDSRAYLIDADGGYWTQITSDHTLVQALVDAGHINADEADGHPMKNVLYRALGQSREIDVDVYFEKMHVGDRLVLCSDGLTLHVKPEEIAQLAVESDPAECSQKLIDLANERGGHDNISVIVIKVEENCLDSQPAADETVEVEVIPATDAATESSPAIEAEVESTPESETTPETGTPVEPEPKIATEESPDPRTPETENQPAPLDDYPRESSAFKAVSLPEQEIDTSAHQDSAPLARQSRPAAEANSQSPDTDLSSSNGSFEGHDPLTFNR